MMRKSVLLILLFAVSTGVMALGLGNIELNSGLNQPFDARIVLLSPTASELDSLTVTLADIDAFDRAGIERSFILSSLRFAVLQGESGHDYIHITSREALREPFLNFLVDASWSNGRLFREYTVLLDPPLYDPNVRRSAPADTSTQQTSSAPIDSTGSGSPQGSESGQFVSSFSGNEVGPTSANDTLWSVANRVRPDSSVSVNQMMIALLRANPEAFIGNNINGLKQGQILRVPALDEITTTTYTAAIEEVSSQNAMWEEVRGTIAANTPARPISTSAEPVVQESPAVPVAQSESELRLLAATDQGTGGGQTGGAVSSTNSDASLALMNEQLESMTSENTELRDRLSESETIIEDLKRLIELKDDELATMQQQIGGSTVVETESAGVDTGITEGETVEQPEVAIEQEPEVVVDDTATTAGAEAAEAKPSAEPEQEAVVEVVVTDTTPEPVVEPEIVIPPEQSILDQIIGFVTDNIIMVGGAVGGLILIAMAVAFIWKRKSSENESELTLPTEFPDFESSAAARENDGPQIDIKSDNKPAKATESMGSPAPVAAQAEIPVEVAPPAQHEVADEDPLAEVNVFLAYEHFDSAEEFVREAISRQPNNLDFHSKLLEVFYSAGDKPKYEAEAKVLNELVDGAGSHWDMAIIMWQEMSPNRPLFSEPAEGEDDAKADITSGRGIVDLTADDADSADNDAGLDFDLGMADESVPAKQSAGADDVLDITASASRQAGDEDILDVTAAVGLGSMQADAGNDNYSLDMPAGDDNDILDISASGSDDPLDVTAHLDLEPEGGEDLLDMSATGSGIGNKADSNALDFDIGGISSDAGDEGNLEVAGTDENMIDFDAQSVSSGDDGGIELDFGTGESTDDGSLELTMDSGGQDDDGGIELDFGPDNVSDTDDSGLELTMDSGGQDDDGGIELDFSGVEEAASSGAEIDMESTLKIPKSSVPSLENFEEDDEDHTVFVPRSKDTSKQSAEDENATKLDLAKAYVELGEKIKAESILEEVMADGNTSQRQQAQELMAQII